MKKFQIFFGFYDKVFNCYLFETDGSFMMLVLRLRMLLSQCILSCD